MSALLSFCLSDIAPKIHAAGENADGRLDGACSIYEVRAVIERAEQASEAETGCRRQRRHPARVRGAVVGAPAQDPRLSRPLVADRRRDRGALRHVEAVDLAASQHSGDGRPHRQGAAGTIHPLLAGREQSGEHAERLRSGRLPGVAPDQTGEQGAGHGKVDPAGKIGD